MKKFDIKPIKIDVAKAEAVTAMVVGNNGKIYAGLTGKTRVLAEIDPVTDKVVDMGEIYPLQEKTKDILDKIHNSLVKSKDGTLYIGQGLNIGDGFPADYDLVQYEGGHLYSFNIETGKINDYGVLISRNAVQGMVIDSKHNIIYGYTIPDNHFFVYDISKCELTDHGRISQLGFHNLLCASKGYVYGVWNSLYGIPLFATPDYYKSPITERGAYILKYDPDKKRLYRTSKKLPTCAVEEINPIKNRAWTNGFDSICESRSGDIYFGTPQEGYIFRMNPEDNDKIDYIGKPVVSSRIPCMEQGPDGKIYGAAGFPKSHLFSYDPITSALVDYGEIESKYDMCLMHTMSITEDGAIYFGETDSKRAIVYKCSPL